mmetsp:Transcript_3390/g.8720  ORF Transcript_3390/g.8720 Transcript_3390/m.8720 type:complete len:420 (+) Transcript_3390:1055-2314(+)
MPEASLDTPASTLRSKRLSEDVPGRRNVRHSESSSESAPAAAGLLPTAVEDAGLVRKVPLVEPRSATRQVEGCPSPHVSTISAWFLDTPTTLKLSRPDDSSSSVRSDLPSLSLSSNPSSTVQFPWTDQREAPPARLVLDGPNCSSNTVPEISAGSSTVTLSPGGSVLNGGGYQPRSSVSLDQVLLAVTTSSRHRLAAAASLSIAARRSLRSRTFSPEAEAPSRSSALSRPRSLMRRIPRRRTAATALPSMPWALSARSSASACSSCWGGAGRSAAPAMGEQDGSAVKGVTGSPTELPEGGCGGGEKAERHRRFGGGVGAVVRGLATDRISIPISSASSSSHAPETRAAVAARSSSARRRVSRSSSVVTGAMCMMLLSAGEGASWAFLVVGSLLWGPAPLTSLARRSECGRVLADLTASR